jgi:hypothetical protein
MAKPLSSQVQTILSDAYLFFIGNLKQIAAVCLPFLFLSSMFSFILAGFFEDAVTALFASGAVNLFIYPVYTAALIQLMAMRARQAQPTNGELILMAIKFWAPLLIVKIIVSLLIALAGLFLTFAGIHFIIKLFFFIPIIWVVVRFAFAEFHVVIFGMAPIAAIKRSFQDTRDHWMLVFVVILVTYVPIFVFSLAADQFVQNMAPNGLFRIVVNTASSLIVLFVHVALFRVFMDALPEQEASQPPPDEA